MAQLSNIRQNLVARYDFTESSGTRIDTSQSTYLHNLNQEGTVGTYVAANRNSVAFDGDLTDYLFAYHHADLSIINSKPFSFSMWVEMVASGAEALISKGVYEVDPPLDSAWEWAVIQTGGSGAWVYTFLVNSYPTGTDTYYISTNTAAEATDYVHLAGSYDPDNGQIMIWLNGVKTTSQAEKLPTGLDSNLPMYVGGRDDSGLAPEVRIENLTLWNRALNDNDVDWILADENTLTFSQWPALTAVTTVDTCKSIECCAPDDYETVLNSGGDLVDNIATDKLGEIPEIPEIPDPDPCAVDAAITFDPPTGSCVTFPIFVGLTSNLDSASIFYTTDGTEPETTATLTTSLYAGTPLTISNQSTIIKARAVVDGCDDFPVYNANYESCGLSIALEWLCSTTDTVGEWEDFTTNSEPDQNWRLNITFPVSTTITRMEMYQLDSTLAWTTGQAWATDNPIYPFPEFLFRVFPLGVDVGAGLVHTDYIAEFGAYNGATTFDLFGDIDIDELTTDIFRLKMFLADGRVLYADTTADVCVPATTPCEVVPTPTLSRGCNIIAATLIGGSITAGKTVNVWRSTKPPCGNGVPIIIGELTSDPTNQTHTDTGLSKDCVYEYHFEAEFGGTCGNIEGEKNQASPFGLPDITLEADVTEVESGGDVVLSWSSSDTRVEGACATASLIINDGSSDIITTAGNTTGNQTVNPTVDTTYTARVCNACGTVTADVSVTINGTNNTCPPGPHPASVSSSHFTHEGGFSDAFGPIPADLFTSVCACCSTSGLEWDGTLFNDPATGGNDCYYGRVQSLHMIVSDNSGGNTVIRGVEVLPLIFFVDGTPGYWVLRVSCASGSGNGVMWEGRKTEGDDATGAYTRYAPQSQVFESPTTVTIT